MDDWDPIGINRAPGALDEYNGYIDGVYQFLKSESSEQEIYDYLYEIESTHMGLSSAGTTTKTAVEKLVKIKLVP